MTRPRHTIPIRAQTLDSDERHNDEAVLNPDQGGNHGHDNPTEANPHPPDNGRVKAQVVAQAAAAAVAVPVAVNAVAVGVMTALGFQAGGIAAGSAAAAMMSSAAAAGGGAVTAGSAVATMQSIGAAGVALGPVGWVALGAVGLVVSGRTPFGSRGSSSSKTSRGLGRVKWRARL